MDAACVRHLEATLGPITAGMQTIGSIFLLAIVALGVSIYTDEIFTRSPLKSHQSQSMMSLGFVGDLKF